MEDTLLEVRDLQVEFSTKMGIVRVLDKVNLKVDPRQTVGIIGESGCGKSMMALSIMGLVPIPPGRIAGGEILYRGTDLLTLEKDAILDIRGKRIAMIFQEPMNSLNPVFTVGNQLVETLLRHEDMTRRDAWDKSVDMLKAVGIPSPEKRMHDYSFQMSGGMRQRVMIAMSLCLDPDILIADEPTTALDVTVQAQILDLLREMQDRVGASIIMITHDLGVVAEVSDKVAVMYAGRKVEKARSSRFCSTRSIRIRKRSRAVFRTSSGRPQAGGIACTKSLAWCSAWPNSARTAVRSTSAVRAGSRNAWSTTRPQRRSTPDMKWPAGSTADVGP